ncbi:hypothetical protein SAMD00019534_032180 [Acytostelium subglobosum LB1]|uniref:hypothetical protein n=1 Tax=Acytostelium subglobosum LB1 TaxID=1410327 RepID=UPI000644BBF4|nr:hypothetical protein SAMD00019534_032180 [Acytostelium subglobosum LB1]GAM20043.1 hypothetical protein SAMD00019534_032180 [Acytostelium subglobosum LB1]|eukprot:XP_012756805.1 hypothetical protein SAMD00019534_032180 [Acytostelium subglobosum LB1]
MRILKYDDMQSAHKLLIKRSYALLVDRLITGIHQYWSSRALGMLVVHATTKDVPLFHHVYRIHQLRFTDRALLAAAAVSGQVDIFKVLESQVHPCSLLAANNAIPKLAGKKEYDGGYFGPWQDTVEKQEQDDYVLLALSNGNRQLFEYLLPRQPRRITAARSQDDYVVPKLVTDRINWVDMASMVKQLIKYIDNQNKRPGCNQSIGQYLEHPFYVILKCNDMELVRMSFNKHIKSVSYQQLRVYCEETFMPVKRSDKDVDNPFGPRQQVVYNNDDESTPTDPETLKQSYNFLLSVLDYTSVGRTSLTKSSMMFAETFKDVLTSGTGTMFLALFQMLTRLAENQEKPQIFPLLSNIRKGLFMHINMDNESTSTQLYKDLQRYLVRNHHGMASLCTFGSLYMVSNASMHFKGCETEVEQLLNHPARTNLKSYVQRKAQLDLLQTSKLFVYPKTLSIQGFNRLHNLYPLDRHNVVTYLVALGDVLGLRAAVQDHPKLATKSGAHERTLKYLVSKHPIKIRLGLGAVLRLFHFNIDAELRSDCTLEEIKQLTVKLIQELLVLRADTYGGLIDQEILKYLVPFTVKYQDKVPLHLPLFVQIINYAIVMGLIDLVKWISVNFHDHMIAMMRMQSYLKLAIDHHQNSIFLYLTEHFKVTYQPKLENAGRLRDMVQFDWIISLNQPINLESWYKLLLEASEIGNRVLIEHIHVKYNPDVRYGDLVHCAYNWILPMTKSSYIFSSKTFTNTQFISKSNEKSNK